MSRALWAVSLSVALCVRSSRTVSLAREKADRRVAHSSNDPPPPLEHMPPFRLPSHLRAKKSNNCLSLNVGSSLSAGIVHTPSSLEHKHFAENVAAATAENVAAATEHRRSTKRNGRRDEQTDDRDDHSETSTNASSTAQVAPPPVHPERLPHPFRRDPSKDERRAQLVRAASSSSRTSNPKKFGTPDSKDEGSPRSRGRGKPSPSGRRIPHSESGVASRSDGWLSPHSRDRGSSRSRGGGVPHSNDGTPRFKGEGAPPSHAESMITSDDDVASGRSAANFLGSSKDENTSALLTSSNLDRKRARGRPGIRGEPGTGQDASVVGSARSASNGTRSRGDVGGSTTSEVTLSNRGYETDDSETTDGSGDVVGAAVEEEARLHASDGDRGGDRDRVDGFQQKQGSSTSSAAFTTRQDGGGAQTRQQHRHQERPYGGAHDEEKASGRSGAPPRSSSAAQQTRNRRMAAVASGRDDQDEGEHEGLEVRETDGGVISSPAAAARLRKLRARLISGKLLFCFLIYFSRS